MDNESFLIRKLFLIFAVLQGEFTIHLLNHLQLRTQRSKLFCPQRLSVLCLFLHDLPTERDVLFIAFQRSFQRCHTVAVKNQLLFIALKPLICRDSIASCVEQRLCHHLLFSLQIVHLPLEVRCAEGFLLSPEVEDRCPQFFGLTLADLLISNYFLEFARKFSLLFSTVFQLLLQPGLLTLQLV